MRKYTEEMTCSKCGNKFSHEFGDAVTPADVEFRKHPLCGKCRMINTIKELFNSHDDFMAEHPLVTGPVIINPFKIVEKIKKVGKRS